MILKRKKQPDLIKKFFSNMAILAKNGVWLGAFLIEVNFSNTDITVSNSMLLSKVGCHAELIFCLLFFKVV